MKRIIVLGLLILNITASAFCDAATPETLLTQGKKYYHAKEFEKAYVLFHKAFMQNPVDLDISFFMGRAAFEQAMIAKIEGKEDLSQKRLEAALMAFDRVLIMDPAAVRVKLEIARCHMQLGSYQLARQYFHEVLNTQPPEPVKKNIQLYLATMNQQEKKHFLNGSLSIGVSADDNVYSAPGSYQLTFTGAAGDITIDVSSEPNADFIYTVAASLNHLYKFEDSPYTWNTSVTDLNSMYNKYSDLDLHFLGITTGPTYQKDNFFVEVYGSLNTLTLGRQGYVQPMNIGTSANFLFGPRLLVSTSVQFEKKDYKKDTDTGKNAHNIIATFRPIITTGKNRLTGNVSIERENADVSSYSYDRIQGGIRLERMLSNDFTVFTSFDMKTTDYDLIKTGDPAIRSDELQNFSLGANKVFWKSKDKSKNLMALINYTYTDSESTIAIYTFNKSVIAATFTYNF